MERMPTKTDAHIGERVHHLLWTQHRNQRALAGYLGLNETTLSHKIRGKRPWTIDEVLGAASFLDCRLADLLPPAPPAWKDGNHPLRNTLQSSVARARLSWSSRSVRRSSAGRVRVLLHPFAA